MKYNFDEIIPRRGTASYKWDSSTDSNLLPMWVADMDFRTAPPIIAALQKRALYGVWGYTKVPDAYFVAVQHWFEQQYHFSFQKSWILPTTGVVPALSCALKAFTQHGDKVLLQSPVYNCFFSIIFNNHCEVVSNDLIYENGEYHIDFEDLDRKTSDEKVKVFLLCHPHNPAGRVWTKEELLRMGEICLKNKVWVVSDEIHCDFVYPPHQHISFGSISEAFLQNSVTCISPSKTFNLAGIQVANIVVANEEYRKCIQKILYMNDLHSISPFAVDALIAAYNESEDWIKTLRVYLYNNYQYVKKFVSENLPMLKVTPLEATYLVWIDCSALQLPSKEIAQKLLTEQSLWVNDGSMYGSNQEGFIRLNIACPRVLLQEGLQRMKNAFLK